MWKKNCVKYVRSKSNKSAQRKHRTKVLMRFVHKTGQEWCTRIRQQSSKECYIYVYYVAAARVCRCGARQTRASACFPPPPILIHSPTTTLLHWLLYAYTNTEVLMWWQAAERRILLFLLLLTVCVMPCACERKKYTHTHNFACVTFLISKFLIIISTNARRAQQINKQILNCIAPCVIWPFKK